MRLLTLIAFLTTELCLNAGCGTNVCPGDTQSSVTNTQDDVDAFAGCTDVSGDINIQVPGDGLDLSAFSDVERIGGSLIVMESLEFSTFTDFTNLTSIDENLEVRGTSLKDFSGLESLTTIGQNLLIGDENYGDVIQVNTSLESLHGLESLREIGRSLIVEHNKNLANIDALAGIQSFGEFEPGGDPSVPPPVGFVFIRNNPVLETLDGLSGLTSVPGGISIYKNDLLNDVSGLRNVDSIGESLTISENDLVQVIDMPLIDEVNDLILSENDLRSLQGFDAMRTIRGDVALQGNMIPVTHIDDFLEQLEDFDGEVGRD